MLLKCKACGAALDEEQVDLERGLATCPYCKALTKFKTASPDREEESIVPLPERFLVEEADGVLKITRPWFSPGLFVILGFGIAWNAFWIFWLSKAVEGDAPWIFFVFPLPFAVIGAGMLYVAAGGLINRTVVTVHDGRIGVWNGPLPWIGNVTVEAEEVAQIYCYERTRHGKNGSRTDYQVYAVTKAGRRTQLLVGLPEAAQALYVERRLEGRLGIKDRTVAGEMAD